jgi:peroxiredoxin/predicted 2-oxoglutarate/Fe(II)-dependent dioxygenase YbiX
MPALHEGRAKLFRIGAPPSGAAGPLAAGDRAAPFTLPDENGAAISPWAIRSVGTPIALTLGGSVGAGDYLDELRAFRDAYPALEGMHAKLFAVTRDSVADNRVARDAHHLPFPLLSDPEGSVRRSYGFGPPSETPVTVLLDPNCRVASVIETSGNARHAMRVLRHLEDAAAVGPAPRLSTHAPVLIVPRVLSQNDCAMLIERWHRPAPEWEADPVTHACAGYQVETGDFKLRENHYGHVVQLVVRDPALQALLDARLARRLTPELERAFQTSITHREAYRIAGYDANDDGGLPQHRDNNTPATRHRRFTVSIALNAGAYEGGALRFREYGEPLYQVETGAAIVWSAALLHEVLPVTMGQRFILGTHLSGA